jgi:hypothetical protein
MKTLPSTLRHFLIFVLPLAAAPEMTRLPEPSAWRFAHPDAQILAGADLFRLGQSPLGEKLRHRFLAAMGPDLSRHVQRLLVSTAFLPDGKADSILILSGPLDAGRIKQMAVNGQATLKTYKGIEVILPPGGAAEETHFAIIDAQTALLGNRLSVTAAIDRSHHPPRHLSESNLLFARALDLIHEAEVWALTGELPAGFGPGSWDAKSSVELVLNVNQKADLSIGIALPDPGQVESAQRALDADRSRQPPPTYVLSSWLPRLASLRQAGGIVLSGHLEESALVEKFPALATAVGLPVKQAASEQKREPAAVLPQPAAPPEPPALKIRIEGLENGTIEIPYSPKNSGATRK